VLIQNFEQLKNMSRRKKSVPTKRKVEEEDFAADLVLSVDYMLKEMQKNITPSIYPVFYTFKSELRIYYLFDSTEDIEELSTLFGDRMNKDGTKTRNWFGRQICNWKLYYRTDIEKHKKEVVEMINIGCKLLDNGLELKISNIPDAGYGLFATKNFAQGQHITYYGGYYCNVNIFETHSAPKEEADYIFTFPEKEWGIGGILDARTFFKLGYEMGRWANSDEKKRNIMIDREYRKDGPPMMYYFAMRDIEAGEEIYYDYGASYGFNLTNACVVCCKVTAKSMCEDCRVPICGSTCHVGHIEKIHLRKK
jgi:hypothetical protein